MLHFSSCSVGLHENIPWTNSFFRSVPTLHSNLRIDERPTLETSASFTYKVIARGRVKLRINVTRFSEVAEIAQVTQRRGQFQQLLFRTQVCHFETTEGLARVADVYRPLNGNFFLLSPALYYFRHPRWRHDFATFRFDPHQNTPALQDILHCSLTKRKQGHSSTKETKLRYGRILIPAIQTGRTNSGFHRNQTFLIVCSPIKFKRENDPYQSEFSQMR